MTINEGFIEFSLLEIADPYMSSWFSNQFRLHESAHQYDDGCMINLNRLKDDYCRRFKSTIDLELEDNTLYNNYLQLLNDLLFFIEQLLNSDCTFVYVLCSFI